MMILLLGAGVGIGAMAVVRGVRPPTGTLADALLDLDRPRVAGAPRSSWLVRRLGGSPDDDRAADLAVAGRTADQQALRRIIAGVSMAAIPALAGALAGIAGVRAPLGAVAVATVALAGVGVMVPEIELRGLARERRAAFVHALSGYLDVTAVLLAGGAGTETALYSAASLSDSWPYQRLRAALDGSRLSAQTPWHAFGALGQRLGVDELTQLAASLELAGEHGARVRTTLADRARALRARQLSQIEAQARAATEQMTVPVALLAVAFMLFVGFPAVSIVLGEL